MQNFIQEGKTITALAPQGGIASGAGMALGTLFGIAAYDAAAGAEVELVQGVFTLPKASLDDLSAGDAVYWDTTSGEVTATATAHTLIGATVAAAGAGTTTATVRLNGVAVVAPTG